MQARHIERIERPCDDRAAAPCRHLRPILLDRQVMVVVERDAGRHQVRFGPGGETVERCRSAGLVDHRGFRVAVLLPHHDNGEGEHHGIDNADGGEFESRRFRCCWPGRWWPIQRRRMTGPHMAMQVGRITSRMTALHSGRLDRKMTTVRFLGWREGTMEHCHTSCCGAMRGMGGATRAPQGLAEGSRRAVKTQSDEYVAEARGSRSRTSNLRPSD